MIGYLQTKATQFAQQIGNYHVTESIINKKSQLAEKVNSLSPTLISLLHIVPIVNIPFHYLKEEGVNLQAPARRLDHMKKFKIRHLKNESTMLKKQIDALEESMNRLQNTANSSKNIAQIANEWRYLCRKSDEIDSELEKVKEERADISFMLAINEEIIQKIEKEEQKLRTIFRVSLIALAILALTAVTLSAFSLIPVVVGIGAILAFGVSLGTHIALCKSAQWQFEGEMTIEKAQKEGAERTEDDDVDVD